MDFKDYAGYYIGCRCFNTWFPEDHEEYDRDWILRGVCNNVTSYYKSFLLENDDDFTWTDSIKPILRKLEDITDDEIKELIAHDKAVKIYDYIRYRKHLGGIAVTYGVETDACGCTSASI